MRRFSTLLAVMLLLVMWADYARAQGPAANTRPGALAERGITFQDRNANFIGNIGGQIGTAIGNLVGGGPVNAPALRNLNGSQVGANFGNNIGNLGGAVGANIGNFSGGGAVRRAPVNVNAGGNNIGQNFGNRGGVIGNNVGSPFPAAFAGMRPVAPPPARSAFRNPGAPRVTVGGRIGGTGTFAGARRMEVNTGDTRVRINGNRVNVATFGANGTPPGLGFGGVRAMPNGFTINSGGNNIGQNFGNRGGVIGNNVGSPFPSGFTGVGRRTTVGSTGFQVGNNIGNNFGNLGGQIGNNIGTFAGIRPGTITTAVPGVGVITTNAPELTGIVGPNGINLPGLSITESGVTIFGD